MFQKTLISSVLSNRKRTPTISGRRWRFFSSRVVWQPSMRTPPKYLVPALPSAWRNRRNGSTRKARDLGKRGVPRRADAPHTDRVVDHVHVREATASKAAN